MHGTTGLLSLVHIYSHVLFILIPHPDLFSFQMHDEAHYKEPCACELLVANAFFSKVIIVFTCACRL